MPRLNIFIWTLREGGGGGGGGRRRIFGASFLAFCWTFVIPPSLRFKFDPLRSCRPVRVLIHVTYFLMGGLIVSFSKHLTSFFFGIINILNIIINRIQIAVLLELALLVVLVLFVFAVLVWLLLWLCVWLLNV